MPNTTPPAPYETADLTTLLVAHKMRGWTFHCSGDAKSVQLKEDERTPEFCGRPPLVIDESELPY